MEFAHDNMKFARKLHIFLFIISDISVPSTCKDSPFFTSCAMIVKQNYCINPTYAKYCCLSCAISGQLQNSADSVS